MRRVVTVSLAAFVVLGMPDGALGVAWPSIRHDLGLPVDRSEPSGVESPFGSLDLFFAELSDTKAKGL